MKNFGLIGSAGYIAARHMRAIKDTGNRILCATDRNDVMGIMDSYFPQATFYTEFERFEKYIDDIKRNDNISVDYISVCSPNYLHEAHANRAMALGADVICEKPLALNPQSVDALKRTEESTGKRVNTILQLRVHPALLALKEQLKNQPKDKKHDVNLTYITSRGLWYYSSWKGDERKSGGIATNIGIHFFDMLNWLFGDLQDSRVHILSHDRGAGYLEFENARVRWFLSINADTLPADIKYGGQRTYRSITVDGEEIEFSGGFTDLHTVSYQKILAGDGFGLDIARPAVELAYNIRNTAPIGLKGDYHPFAQLPLMPYPQE